MTEAVVSEGGRVVIPAELRAKLGISVGDRLIWQEEDGRLVLTTRRAQLRRAQAIFAKYKRPGEDIVESLLRERREEAARE